MIVALVAWGLVAPAAAADDDDAFLDAAAIWLGIDRVQVSDEQREQARGAVAERVGDRTGAEAIAAACDEGDTAACAVVAWQLGFVDGRPSAEAPDPQAAAHAAEKACAKGHLRACVAHARLAQRGIGTPGDPEAAAARFRAACDRGEPRGCLWLAKAHQLGLGVPRDLEETRRRAESACTEGHPAGCNTLGLALHLGSGGDKDLGRARALYDQSCQAGFAPACDNLDKLYQGGLPDVPDRVHHLTAACEATPPHVSACAHLGEALVGDAPEAAMGPLQTACDAKLARGCAGVALLVLDERVAGDVDRALELLGGACDVGEPAACARIGDEHAHGDRLPKDWGAAWRARSAACDGGHGPACAAAAWQARKGRGTDKSKDVAEELLGRACVLGVLEACP